MKIILKWKPQSTNHIYKYTCRGRYPTVYMTQEWKDLKYAYEIQAKSQYKWKPLEWDVETYVKLYFSTKHKHDIDNYCKILLDSLSWICYIDDNQIVKQTVEKCFDKENPRIEIEIKENAKKLKLE